MDPPNHHKRRHDAAGASPWYRRVWAFAFAFNYVVAVSVNNVPNAFFRGGYILTASTLVVTTAVSYVTSVWMLEVLARAEGLRNIHNSDDDGDDDAGNDSTGIARDGDEDVGRDGEGESLLVNDAHPASREHSATGYGSASSPAITPPVMALAANTPTDGVLPASPLRPTKTGAQAVASPIMSRTSNGTKKPVPMTVGRRKYEIAELVKTFLGLWPRNLYLITHLLFSFGKLWAFASLFATTFAEITPLAVAYGGTPGDVCDFGLDDRSLLPPSCIKSYQTYIVICACLMTILSQLSFTQLRLGQVLLMAYRVIALVLMIASIFTGLTLQSYHGASSRTSAPFVADDILPFKGNGFLYMLPTIVLAQVSHHAIPDVVHVDTSSDKSRLHRLYFASLLSTGGYYLLLGIIIPLWMGRETEEIVTSNWICFTNPCIANSVAFDVLVRYPVVLLPVALAISSFPLEVITMSDNVRLLFTPAPTPTRAPTEITWRERTFRVLYVVMPVLCAVFIYDFSTAIAFTSLFGVFLAFIFPSLLQYYSKEVVDRAMLDERLTLLTHPINTPYTGFYSEKFWTIAVFLLSCSLLVLLLVSAIMGTTQ